MVDRDIFGNPILPPEERRGRPKHQPTDDSRLVVKVMSAVLRTGLTGPAVARVER
jgi:hypothetical protein